MNIYLAQDKKVTSNQDFFFVTTTIVPHILKIMYHYKCKYAI